MNIKALISDITSWIDFQKKLTGLPKKQKGDAFELLTKIFFKINPVYNFYDEVWMLSEVPQKELEYLELPAHDLGIDLIAKSGNQYHAIQCKYHSDKNQSVTFKEVSTFISLLESNDKISQGYICSSAYVTSRNFNKLKTKPINLLMSDTWQMLDEDFFNRAKNYLEDKRQKLTPFKPREHQQKALDEAKEYFIVNDESRGKLIFPCGSGKSLTGFWITQELQSKSTIVAVPSLSLVKQTLEVYLREIVAKGESVKWLCICSDEGIGKNDDVVYYTQNLGVPCQTDPDYIEKWLEENRNENKIIFTTYQSGRIIADISTRLNFKFEVGIFDEAHKTVGSNKKLFSHLLFDENISIDKRIFMTATERFYSGSKDDIISMDDEGIYGDTFAKMSFKEAIELGLLTDYKVITIDVKKSEIAEFIRDNNLVQLNNKWKKETEARSLAAMLALRKAMKQYDIKNAVSFHSSIEKAVRNKELQKYITDTYNYEPIDTYTVSGKIPTTKRNDIVQEFANSPKALITNARCLTEGVDVPNIDCIVFADPRKSKVDIVQALGRALRKKEGKDWGYVILPVVYDDETQEIDNDSFNEILSVVRGLASNDERIIAYLKDKSDGISNGKTRDKNDNFKVISDYLNEEELTKQLQIKLWDKLAKLNWMSFKEARDFVHELGLRNFDEWRKYLRSGDKPQDIPSIPNSTYKNKGWKSWGDWLRGTDEPYQKFKTFNEAREFVHKLGFKNRREWKKYVHSGEKPKDIRSNPSHTYRNEGWKSWGDWLRGTNEPYSKYKTFEEAREFVHELGLKSTSEWNNYFMSEECPKDIPSNPSHTYKNEGWKSWGDWLRGTNEPYSKYKTFEEAREFVHELGLKSTSEWNNYFMSEECPKDIPSNPSHTYKNEGWKSWGDWLRGTNEPYSKYKTFEEAREFVHTLELKTQKQWKEFIKSGEKPNYIPSTPNKVYKDDGWLSFGDWLGTTKGFNGEYLSYNKAKEITSKLGLKNVKEWME